MNNTTAANPLDILEDYERRARESAVQIPKTQKDLHTWFGIGFKIANTQLTLSSTSVQELLNYPHVYHVPGTRSWVKGLANVRGRILTIVDLAGFLLNRPTVVKPRSRIMSIRDDTMQTAFLVDSVSGMKHFSEDSFNPETDGFPDWIRPFLSGQYVDREETWGVVNLTSVINSPEFIQVGL